MSVSVLGSILSAIVADLHADTNLPEPIATFHKVEGMVPGVDTTCSLWVSKQKFKTYTNDMDEVEAEIHIGVCLQDMDAETAEERIRALAEEIRLVLTADDPLLGGLLDASMLSDWDFATYNASQTEVLHLGEAVWQVCYYAPRYRTAIPQPTDEVDVQESQFNGS